MKAIIFQTDGLVTETEAQFTVYEDTGTEPKLEWLREVIGCEWVQAVPVKGGTLWLDEEGKLQDPIYFNDTATAKFHRDLMEGDFVAGNAVFIPGGQ